MTLSERELLHHILEIALEQPKVFGATVDTDSKAPMLFCAAVERIKKKLPPRGAGTY